MRKLRFCLAVVLSSAASLAAAAGCPSGVPTGCDASVMSEAYWKIWNEAEQAKIDADIEANRKTEGAFRIPAPAGTDVRYEQIDHDFRFGAHIFNFNQLGKTEWNDAYKASYGQGGIFNQATVAFYWTNYEPTPGHLRANGAWEDTEAYWNALTPEQAMFDVNWRRPAPGPVIDFLKTKDVAIHGHILIWGSAKPYWIYDWYCPEREKRAFDALGIPRHSTFMKRAKAGAEGNFGFAREWKAAWSRNYNKASEAELERMAPVFTANMRRLFRKRVYDVAGAFGDVADSWDVVNESAQDWAKYRRSRTGHKVWKSEYGLMPGDYPLHALMDAKEAISPTANLAINDYHISPDFLEQVKQLEAEGAKIDIVGCQMHIFNTNDCMRLAHGATDVNWVGTPQVIQDRLDMMAKTGKPLHVSEITITSPGADSRSRQIQAILTRNIYRKWFSHRALMGITWWNTVDGGGVYGEPLVSGLFTRDMKKKPAYEALDELINREWKTTGTAKVVGEGGSVSFRGFRGRYRLSWTCPACGNTHSRVVELSGDGVVETAAQPRPEGCVRYVRNFTVDGRSVRVDAPATALDLAKIYPKDVIRGKDGDRWADVACTFVAPKDGAYAVLYQNDWFGRLLVNGQRVGGDLSGPYNGLRRLEVPLKKGKNQFVFQTRSGSVGEWTFTLALPVETPVSIGGGSEDYFTAARTAYVRPEYAACTNTVITQWTTATLDRADCPTPGGHIGWVAVEGMRNVRDIGGWNGLRPGRAYRGTEPDGHRKDGVLLHGLEITSNGLETVRSVMRIKTDLDLRGVGECPHPDVSSLGVTLVRAPVRAYDGLDATKDQWAAALRLFADARHYPIYFHCWGGADRTGQLAFLLEGLCGVSECDLCIDYELTTFGGYPRLRSRGFVDLLNRIKSRPGAALKDRFADFVERELGLTKQEVAAIRRNLTEEKMDETVPAVLAEFAKSDEHPRNSEGDVIRLRDGRLLVVYSHFYKDASSKFADGGSDDSSAELVLTESADGGRTWSKMRTAVRKGKGTLNVMSASFLRLGDGRLALFYLNKISSADCRPVMVVSSDEGKTWSSPIDCVSEREKGYYVLNNARAVRLKTGRIALPLAYHPFDGKRHEEGAFLLCALSDDDGRTWRLSSDRRRGTPPPGAKKLSLQEPGLVELRDGRLMMYARSNERRQWRLFSTDNGEHWTEPEPVTEYATTTFSPVTYARLADGRLIVVFNDGAAHADKAPDGLERRWPLAVGVSSDEGKSWTKKVLEPDDPKGTVHACYTAAREIDGRLVLVYCHRDMLATTRVVSVPLEWLP